MHLIDYQVLFADEMESAFAEAAADHRTRGFSDLGDLRVLRG